VAALPRFAEEATAAVLALVPGGRMVAYGHVGDGNLHFNVSVPAGGDAQAFLAKAPAIHDAVHGIVRRHRGSISAEHGIGRLKREALGRYKGAVDLEVMRALKFALDPKGILNPGKVLPDPDPAR
jgi:FAD/FMN-containing dehydrogenase